MTDKQRNQLTKRRRKLDAKRQFNDTAGGDASVDDGINRQSITFNDIPGIEGKGFILVRRGIVQLFGQDGKLGVIIAKTHEGAKRLRDRFNNGATIAAVGSVAGECPMSLYLAHVHQGARGLWVTDGELLDWYTPA
jgi:hypothetical protein